jgi:hypothetical protein
VPAGELGPAARRQLGEVDHRLDAVERGEAAPQLLDPSQRRRAARAERGGIARHAVLHHLEQRRVRIARRRALAPLHGAQQRRWIGIAQQQLVERARMAEHDAQRPALARRGDGQRASISASPRRR